MRFGLGLFLALIIVISGCVSQQEKEVYKIGWIGPLTGSDAVGA